MDRQHEKMRTALLACGILAAPIYVVTDVVAGSLCPGYSLADQAVSELFAIGAPTSALVVPLFSLSSALLLGFAGGLWMSADQDKRLRFMAIMFAGSALIALLLWNVFPMHRRGEPTSLTDTMHLVLATNPFVLLTLVAGIAAYRGWFRWYTTATIFALLIPAVLAFRYAPEVQANLPTAGLGLAERGAQYAYVLWQVVLAIVVLLQRSPRTTQAAM